MSGRRSALTDRRLTGGEGREENKGTVAAHRGAGAGSGEQDSTVRAEKGRDERPREAMTIVKQPGLHQRGVGSSAACL